MALVQQSKLEMKRNARKIERNDEIVLEIFATKSEILSRDRVLLFIFLDQFISTLLYGKHKT